MRSLLCLLLMTSTATADRPRGGLFRASPGLGYALDRASSCSMHGRMFVGGFAGQYEVTGGLFVGGAITILGNTLLADAPCGVDDGLRFALGAVMGPMLEWYPTDGPFHVFALAGYAEMDQAEGEMREPARGIGGTVGIGWDWNGEKARDARVGVRVQLTGFRTYTGIVEHAALMPAVVATFGLD